MKTARALLRLALPLLFGMALLLTQQASASHALLHTLANHQQQDKSPAHTHHCDLCALDIQLGSAVHSSSRLLLPGADGACLQPSFLQLLPNSPIPVASARGPPPPSPLSA